ncbi:helix-turn-helix transcriptional regulator [Agromyces sp. NPDC058104]|uniref:helix-turn-helix transcriptional regulator n=1 Tax=Agromyces sp. NPDC058104 TaxID=3346342 RepID=UPI0036DD97FA
MDTHALLLTPQEVSEWTGLSMGALAQLRYKGMGPSFIKLTPKTVRYLREQVEEWIEASVQSQTGQF